MYTQCPECLVAFRINADVLQQARGRVRCGNCQSAFNALDHLSESPPPKPVAREPEDESAVDPRSRELLDTLDELTGPESVHMEDTGIEWRIVEENSAAAEGGDHSGEPEGDRPDDAPVPAGSQENIRFDDEPRYDDNTPLPDDFGDDEEPAEWAPPMRRAEDFAPKFEVDESQAELELGAPEDWEGLLDEFGAGDGEAVTASDERDEDMQDGDAAGIAALDESLDETVGEDSGDFEIEAIESEPAPDEEELPELEADAEDDTENEDSGFYSSRFRIVADETGAIDITEDDNGDDMAAGSADAEDDGEPGVDQSGEIDLSAEAQQLDSVLSEDDRPDDSGSFEVEALDEDDDDDAESGDGSGEFDRVAAADDEADDVDTDDASGEFERIVVAAGDDDDAVEDETDDGEAIEASEADTAEDETSDDEESELDDFAAMTANMQIDPAILEAMRNQDLAATMTNEDGSPLVETIIMEGDAVSDMLSDDTGNRQALHGDPASLFDTYVASRVPDSRSRGGRIALGVGIGLLMLGLGGQYLHNERENLATYPLFNRAVAPIYRSLGMPITPDWNVKGWQFEATSGSTGEDAALLTISSRLSNRSSQPLPYPLVHVSLTDRYEEVIGSRVLEPGDYLAAGADPGRLVEAGEDFTATITIASTSEAATGFKLNVCYRELGDQVRCAIEDFQNP